MSDRVIFRVGHNGKIYANMGYIEPVDITDAVEAGVLEKIKLVGLLPVSSTWVLMALLWRKRERALSAILKLIGSRH